MERGRGSSHVYFAQELDEPCVLSLTGSNPCLHLIADMLELVSQSDPSNSGSLKLCKAILRGLENILEVGVQEGKSLDLPENPYARLFQAVQVRACLFDATWRAQVSLCSVECSFRKSVGYGTRKIILVRGIYVCLQGDIKLARMRYFPDYNVATKAHSILQYFTALSSRAIKA